MSIRECLSGRRRPIPLTSVRSINRVSVIFKNWAISGITTLCFAIDTMLPAIYVRVL